MKPDEQPVAHQGDDVRQQIGQALMAIAQERGIDPGWVYGEALVHTSVTLTAVGKEAEAKRLFEVARKAGRIVKTQVDAQTRAQYAVLMA